jgi:AbrB family looped-hinge helix DNA binding protein
MTATVSEKGQVTVPKALRDRLGIRPGEVLDFDEERSTDDNVAELRGRAVPD